MWDVGLGLRLVYDFPWPRVGCTCRPMRKIHQAYTDTIGRIRSPFSIINRRTLPFNNIVFFIYKQNRSVLIVWFIRITIIHIHRFARSLRLVVFGLVDQIVLIGHFGLVTALNITDCLCMITRSAILFICAVFAIAKCLSISVSVVRRPSVPAFGICDEGGFGVTIGLLSITVGHSRGRSYSLCAEGDRSTLRGNDQTIV